MPPPRSALRAGGFASRGGAGESDPRGSPRTRGASVEAHLPCCTVDPWGHFRNATCGRSHTWHAHVAGKGMRSGLRPGSWGNRLVPPINNA